MKKRDPCPPALRDALKEMHSSAEREFVACAARRAFVSFLRSVLGDNDRGREKQPG
jgi:hypothetical protein